MSTIRIASLDGTTVVQVENVEDLVKDYADRGLKLLVGGTPVTPETVVPDGATVTAAPQDAKLG